jgi:hypothetical protein
VQERAGVRSMAERVGSSIGPTNPSATREFSEERLMIVVGSVDADGPGVGFLARRRDRLRAGAGRADGENRRNAVPRRPVGAGPAGGRQQVGVIAIGFATGGV